MSAHYTFDKNFYMKILGDRDYLNSFPTYDIETTNEWQIYTIVREITQDLLGCDRSYAEGFLDGNPEDVVDIYSGLLAEVNKYRKALDHEVRGAVAILPLNLVRGYCKTASMEGLEKVREIVYNSTEPHGPSFSPKYVKDTALIRLLVELFNYSQEDAEVAIALFDLKTKNPDNGIWLAECGITANTEIASRK